MSMESGQCVIDAELTRRGFACWIEELFGEQAFQADVRDTDKLIRVLDGDLEIEMNGHKRRLSEGEELLVPAGTPHIVRNIGGGCARRLCCVERALAQTD